MKNKPLLAALLAIGLGLLIASCSKTQASCSELSKDYLSQVTQLASDFVSADKVAQTTDTMNLVTPITDLRDIRKKAGDLTAPPCALKTHELLLIYMDSQIEGYMAVWSNDIPDSQTHFFQADDYYGGWMYAFTLLQTTPMP